MSRFSHRFSRGHCDRRLSGGSELLLEALESRQLLAAHVLADFLPLSNGAQWNFSGTLDGNAATAVMTDGAGGTIGGFATTRERTVITPTGGGPATVDARYFAHTSTGLRLLRENVQDPETVESTLFGAGVRFFTVQVNDGATVPFTKSLTGSSADGRAWTGTFVGNALIVGLENIQTSAGSFEALRVMITGAISETGSTGWTAAGTMSETRWLVRGVGPVRIDYSSATTFSDIGAQALRYDLGLTSSNRLTGVTSMAVYGRGVAVAFGDTSPGAPDGTNYTGIDINGGTKTRVFTITNTSAHPITLASGSQGFITISGANASEFAVVRQPSQVIQPGQTTPFSVRFDPATTGFQYATISFQTTDANAAPFTFDIRGTGIFLGIIQVLGPQNLAIANGAGSPSTQTGTAFGTATGIHRIQRIFTIDNSGPGALVFTSDMRVVITGADAQDFTVTLQPSVSSLQPGQSVQFKVLFDPSALGPREAVVSIATNDRLNPLFSFAVGGTGA